MKRLCAILLGLMMLAGLCAADGEPLPHLLPKRRSLSRSSLRRSPPLRRRFPSPLPDGTTPLTAAELDWFGRCFFNVVPAGAPTGF